MSNYTVHSLRHLKCGTTRSDDGSNDIEDFATIPDLVAGALSDLLTSVAGQFRFGLIVPFRLDSKAKATVIGQWLSEQNHGLKKVVLVIDKGPDSPKLTVRRIGFDDLSAIQSVRLA